MQIEPKIGQAVQETMSIQCQSNETVRDSTLCGSSIASARFGLTLHQVSVFFWQILEVIRGIRIHFQRYIHGLEHGAVEQAQLGLAHSYSRAKVKFNVNRNDNMIIQAISLLDQLDKDINTFAMRVREWYSWHFPEMNKIVKDNVMYARAAAFIGNRDSLTDDKIPELEKIVLDEGLAKEIADAAKMSMGWDANEGDMLNVEQFTNRVVSLATYRTRLYEYLVSKMSQVAPNVATLIGEMVGARLISHAGSLTNLAKCPASTVQILGAEKALFRALKTKGNTPKYGLIFHSSFIGRAGTKNKGRISRYLANKCTMAARIDAFSDAPTRSYGEALRDQVEERLRFYDSGEQPRKNVDVMRGVAERLGDAAGEGPVDDDVIATGGGSSKKKDKKKDKKKRKRSASDAGLDADEPDDVAPPAAKKAKKEKKEKKGKKKASA